MPKGVPKVYRTTRPVRTQQSRGSAECRESRGSTKGHESVCGGSMCIMVSGLMCVLIRGLRVKGIDEKNNM